MQRFRSCVFCCDSLLLQRSALEAQSSTNGDKRLLATKPTRKPVKVPNESEKQTFKAKRSALNLSCFVATTPSQPLSKLMRMTALLSKTVSMETKEFKMIASIEEEVYDIPTLEPKYLCRLRNQASNQGPDTISDETILNPHMYRPPQTKQRKFLS